MDLEGIETKIELFRIDFVLTRIHAAAAAVVSGKWCKERPEQDRTVKYIFSASPFFFFFCTL